MHYDIAISNYFNPTPKQVLRYGENPHQQAVFEGTLTELFTQLNKDGVTIIQVTHSEKNASYGSHIINLLDGRIEL